MRMPVMIGAALLALAAAPAAAQGPIDTPGTVTHRTAGAHFPERIGELRRTGVRQYDAAGENVSASYALARGDDRLLVTVYIYPSDRLGSGGSRAELCDAEFRSVGAAIAQQNRDARLVGSPSPPPVDGVGPELSRRGVYRMTAPFDGSERPLRSEAYLYCFVGGAWQVKYRATSNAGFDASAEVERLIRAGPWPGRAAPPDPGEIAALLRLPRSVVRMRPANERFLTGP